MHTADRDRLASFKQELGAALGRRLREARIAADVSVIRLARAAGIGRQTLINLEAGHGGGIGLAAVAALADALGCRRSWLAFGEGLRDP